MSGPAIRKAERADAPALLRLITALADFEHLEPPDAAAQARLVQDAFGPRPRFEAWLAFTSGDAEPAGYAITLETYSSFLARPTLYLEDIFVRPECRGRGAGRALLRHCIELAHARGCGRVEWVCLDWNTKARCVYERMGATHLKEWFLYRMTRERMAEFLQRAQASPQVSPARPVLPPPPAE